MNAQRPIRPVPTGTTVTVHEAKTHLSRLLARVEAGEEIVVARGGTPVAKLVPLAPAQPQRRVPGRFAHLLPPGVPAIGPRFWEPLSDEEMGLTDEDWSPSSDKWR